MAQKKSGQEITVHITLPKGVWEELLLWAEQVNTPVESMVAQAITRYLKEERHKAFLASNPIYE